MTESPSYTEEQIGLNGTADREEQIHSSVVQESQQRHVETGRVYLKPTTSHMIRIAWRVSNHSVVD